MHYIIQSLPDSTIMQFSAEFWLEHGRAELPNLASKSQLSMALWKFSIFWAQDFFHCWMQNCHFLSILSAHFPFSECRTLGSVFKAPLQFWVLNLHFLSREFWFFSMELQFSEHIILGSVFIVVFECKNWNFLRTEFPFLEHGILDDTSLPQFRGLRPSPRHAQGGTCNRGGLWCHKRSSPQKLYFHPVWNKTSYYVNQMYNT